MNNIPILKEAFLRGTQVLEDLGVDYVLCGGTLLGLYRGGEFLEHDGDVDVDVLAEDIGSPKEFLKRLQSKVSPTQGFVGYRENYFTITYTDIAENEVKFDIFMVFKDKDTRYRLFPNETRLVWPKHHYIKKDWGELEYEGKKYKIPADVEDWLVTFFGEDWRTPKAMWNWIQDSKNQEVKE